MLRWREVRLAKMQFGPPRLDESRGTSAIDRPNY